MILRRAGLLAAAFTLVAAASASAGTLLMWEFAGELTRPSRELGLADLYPAHMPFRLRVTFDPDATRISGVAPQGIYNAIRESTLHLADLTFTSTGGFIAVNCHFEIGCIPGWPTLSTPVEFWMFNWSSEPLNPAVPSLTRLSDVQIYYNDPGSADGHIPTATPIGPLGLQIAVGGFFPPITTIGGVVQSTQSISDVAVVPEPSSFLLLASGLLGLGARMRRR
jgi:PEP-CTERM motif-containing protein